MGYTTEKKNYDFMVGNNKMIQIFDKNLHKDKNEMFTDIKRKLTKIFSVLNQVIQSNELISYFKGNRYVATPGKESVMMLVKYITLLKVNLKK